MKENGKDTPATTSEGGARLKANPRSKDNLAADWTMEKVQKQGLGENTCPPARTSQSVLQPLKTALQEHNMAKGHVRCLPRAAHRGLYSSLLRTVRTRGQHPKSYQKNTPHPTAQQCCWALHWDRPGLCRKSSADFSCGRL